MRKVLLRTICFLSLFAMLLATVSINAKPVFVGFGDKVLNSRAVTDATSKKQVIRPENIVAKAKKAGTYDTPSQEDLAGTGNLSQISGNLFNFPSVVTSSNCPIGVATFTYSADQVESFQVPAGVQNITIRVIGANGGDFPDNNLYGGKGAILQGTFAVSGLPSTLYILSGQKGFDVDPFGDNLTGGGGGGSFVFTSSSYTAANLLIAAGGGGGAGQGVYPEGQANIHANIYEQAYYGGTVGNGGAGSFGANPGDGGVASEGGGAGAGINSNGSGGLVEDANGKSPANGGNGGDVGYPERGGYGGGGSSYAGGGGGGGGYSGGGGGAQDAGGSAYGGGGGSYISGTASQIERVQGTGGSGYDGNGIVVITWAIPCANPLLAGTIGSPQSICSGTAPNQLTSVTPASGGTGTIAYQWQSSTDNSNFTDIPGATSATYAPGALTTTTYYRRAASTSTDPVVYTPSVQITVNALPTVTANHAGFGCVNDKIELFSSPGASYSWTGPNGFTSNLQNPIIPNGTMANAGTYTVTVTNANGCSASASTTVAVRALPVITASSNGPVCEGATLTLNANGGVDYFWTGPNGFVANNTQNPSIANVTLAAAGTYTVKGAGANGCNSETTVTVTVNALPDFTLATTSVLCNGQANGTITVTATSGTSPFSYSRFGGSFPQVSNIFTGLSAGTYFIVVTDANGCRPSSKGINVTQPAPLNVGASGGGVLCNGSATGHMTITVSGGTAPYSYSKDGGATFQSSNSFTGLTAGAYTFVIKDANGCTSNLPQTLSQPNVLTLTPTVTAVSCGGTNGSISIAGTGGSAPYTYSKDGGTTFQSGNTFNGLAAGTYNLVIKDINGCTATQTVTVTANAGPTISGVSGTTTICARRNTNLTANSTAPSPVFNWYNASNTLLYTGNSYFTGDLFATTTYYVEVVSNGCTSEKVPVTVTVLPMPPQPIISQTQNCDGTTTLAITNAEPGATVMFANTAVVPLTPIIANSVVVTGPAIYKSIQNGANGCQSYDVTINVAANNNTIQAPTITAEGSTTFCAGGSVTLVASEGSSYLWSNGETTQSITATTAGSYTVTVTNASGCSAVSEPTVVTVSTPPVVTITADGPTAICFGTPRTLTVNAPTGLWNIGQNAQSITVYGGSTYTVTVTSDDQICTATASIIITTLPTPYVAPITANAYEVCANGILSLQNETPGGVWSSSNPAVATVDANGTVSGVSQSGITEPTDVVISYKVTNESGCSNVQTQYITVLPLTASIFTQVPAICSGGSLSALPTTSNNGITGTWSPALNNTATTTYTFTPNAGQCASIATMTITVNALPNATASNNGPACVGGSLSLNASGGVSYLWSGPSEFSSTSQNTGIGGITLAYAGTYSVEVTDANGCKNTATTNVVVNALAPIIGANNVCVGSTTTLTASGTPANLNPWWSTNQLVATVNSAGVVTGIAPGNTLIIYTNSSGCTVNKFFSVNALPSASITAGGPTTFCAGGSVTLTASAGTSYSWSNGANSQSITVSEAGAYTVTVSNGACSATSAATVVTVNPLPVVNAVSNQVVCANAATTAVNFTGTGSQYTWTNDNPSIGLAASGSGSIPSFTALNATNAPLVSTVTVTPTTGGGSLIYGSSLGGKLYTFNSASNTLVNVINNGNQSEHVAVSPDGTKIYLANSIANTVAVYNLSNNALIATIPVGSSPQGIVVSPNGSFVYVSNQQNNTISVINASTNTVVNTIVISVAFYPYTTPLSVAISPDGNTLYTANQGGGSFGSIGVINLNTNVVTKVALGSGPAPSDIVVSPSGDKVYVANTNSGNIYVMNTATNAISTINVGFGTAGIGISPDGGHVYATSPYVNKLAVVNTATQLLETAITVGTEPYGVTVTPDGQFVYVANASSNTVSVVSTATNTVTNTINTASSNIKWLAKYVSAPSPSCSGTPITYTYTINPNNTVTLSSAAGTNSQSVCINTSISNITYNTTGATGASFSGLPSGVTGSWSGNVVTISGTPNVTGTFNYNVTLTGGCGTVTAIGTITVSPSIAPTFTQVGAICSGVSLSALPTTSNNGITGTWSPALNNTATTTYTFTPSAGQCASTTTMTITVNPLPVATITAGGPTTFCPGGSVILTASAGTSYLWSNGETTQSITVNSSGSYTVIVTNASNCSATSAVTVVTVQDIIAPVAPVLAPINAQCSATVPVPTAIDNCAGTIAGVTSDPLTYTAQGTYTIHWTFNDGNGNTTTANQTVTILDVTPPSIVCPDNISVTATSPAGAIVTFAAPVGTDNCTGVTTLQTAGLPSGATFPVGTTTQTYTVTDAVGNTVSCSFDVTVNCVTPLFTQCATDQTVNTTAGLCTAVVNYIASASGFPVANLSYTFTGATTGSGSGTGSGAIFNKGVTTVTISAANACGTATCSFTVEVVDNENPVIVNTPSNINQQNDAGQCGAVINWTAPTATDNCPGVTVIASHQSGTVFPVGTTVVTYTATDASGHIVTSQFTVTVTDTENPIITIPADITHSADAGQCSYTFGTDNNGGISQSPNGSGSGSGSGSSGISLGTATATDNCGTTLVTGIRSDAQPLNAPFPVGITTIQWTVTDAHGNTAGGVQTVSITDDEFPVINGTPGTQTVANTPGTCGAVVNWIVPAAADNCPGVTLVADHQPGEVFPMGTTTVHYTATDAHGHTTTSSFDVVVTDTEKPTVQCPSDITVSGNAGLNGAIVTYTIVSADNCGTPSVTTSVASGSYFPMGTTPVTITVTDAAGNQVTCSFTVTVLNNPPVAQPDVATTLEDTPVSGSVLTNDSDADGNAVTVTGYTVNSVSYTAGSTATLVEGELVINADGSFTFTPAANYNGPVPVVNYTIVDINGATASSTLSIQVTPVNDQPLGVDDAATVNEDAVLNGSVRGNDTESGDGGNTWSVVTTTTHGVLTLNPDGTYTYTPAPNFHGTDVFTYQVCDADGDCSTATVIITVNSVDDQPLGVDDAATVNEDAVLNGSVRGNDTESGDGGNTWSVVTTTTHGVLTLNPDGTYTYTPAPNFHGTDVFTYQVCDADGDCSTARVTINVSSVDDAGIVLTKDITVYLDATGNVSITAGQIDDGSYDPDGIASITIDQSNFSCANVGANNVTMTVTDANGNVSTAVAIVTVVDNLAPVITCPAPLTVTCASAVPAPNTGSVVASDNCFAVVTWAGDVISNQQGLNKYTIARTYRATDPSGNTTTCTQVITVMDDIAPVLTGVIPGAAGLQCIADVPGAPDAADIASQFRDNCSGTVTAVLSNTSITGNNANGWTVTYSYAISDASGNTTTVSVVYTGKDTKAPVPVITQLPTVTGECAATVTIPVAIDNCGGTISGITSSALHYTAQGTYFIEWTYNDGNGNVSTQSQTVIVKDITAPIVSCPADITVNASAVLNGQGGAYVTYTATATDNCGTPVISYSIAPGSFFPTGSTPVTVTAVDAKGNATTCTFTVTVGCVNPVISIRSVPTNNTFTGGVPTNLFLGYGAQSTMLQVTTPVGSTYVWSGNGISMLSSTTSANPVFTPTAGGSYTFVVTVMNASGCTSSASITICVTDIRVPGSNISSDDDDDHVEGDDDHDDDDDDDDRQRMCNHSAHSSSSCSHKGHNHTCDHKSHSKYNCSHRGTNDRDDEDQKDCDHKSHSYNDCSHKGHNHASCNHKAHSATDCAHERNHGTNQKVCDHQSHSSADCSHEDHNHSSCSHTAHSSSSCPHGDDDDDDDDDHEGNASGNYKVYLCHVPPGNSGKTITLSISINAVAAHLTLHPGDRLGSCEQQPCSGVYVDNVKPVITCPANMTVSCGGSTLPASTGTASATDNSGNVTITYSDVTNGNVITRSWKAKDAAGNYSTCSQTITLVSPFTTSVTSTPNSNVNTGGVATNLYIGYGATATTLSVAGSLPSSGAPYTYSWSGNGIANCNTTLGSSVVFTPVSAGSYTFTVITKNKYGCAYTTAITICVKDIRERDRFGVLTNSGKVYVCHVPPGNVGNAHTICVSVNAVPAHVPLHGGDRLGTCDQVCGSQAISRPPVINCPGDVTVSCVSGTTPTACGAATGINSNGSAATITYSDIANENVIIRTWVATDPSGNYTECTQKITIVDNVKPVITDPADISVNCGASTAPSATGNATATDNCSAATVTYTDVINGNVITRTWKATDAAGNYSTATQLITVGTPFTTSITSVPTTSTYTGGVATNLYLGYGAQSTKLQVGSLPSAGAPYTYVWTGSYVNLLSTNNTAAPVFTPATFGYYSFTVTVTNKYGCKSIASINICVTDIRVPGTGGSKVYMTHTTTGKYGKTQTIEVPINQVSSHLSSSSCGSNGQDRLGSADQSPCNTTVQNSVVANTATTTKEGGIETATTEEELKVTVLPNPSTTYFTLKLESKYTTPVNLRVMDANGRVVDARSKLGANSTLQIGHYYSSGTYYAEMIQGTQRKVVQLIKGRG